MRRLTIGLGGLVAIGAAALIAVPALVQAHPLPAAPGCPIFPADNPWNQRVDKLPVATNSAQLIASIGLSDPVHPDFGSGLYDGEPIGIPYAVVSSSTPKVPVRFQYSSQSDKGPYPLPKGVPIEGGYASSGDRHVIVVNRDTCTDYELFAAYPHDGGRYWTAGSGAIFNLRSDHLRPASWTSADAAGLPILPGLARYSEVVAGSIDHALRFTAPCTAPRYVYPARHEASTCSGPNLPPMGLRLRLKASFSLAGFTGEALVILQALKTYGMIVADNGSSWYISGATDPRWNDNNLNELKTVPGTAFQVVETGPILHTS